jgi:hypothetical protein
MTSKIFQKRSKSSNNTHVVEVINDASSQVGEIEVIGALHAKQDGHPQPSTKDCNRHSRVKMHLMAIIA